MSVRMQQTLARPVSLGGVGLHTGEAGHVTLPPGAAENTGVRFVRTDLPGRPAVRRAARERHLRPAAPGAARSCSRTACRSTPWSTCWPRWRGWASTTWSSRPTTMEIPEPADGSAAADRAGAARRAGSRPRTRRARHIKITKPVRWKRRRRRADRGALRRAAGSRFTIDYDHPLVGTQSLYARHRPGDLPARDRPGAHLRARARPRGAARAPAGSRAAASRARSWSARTAS